ncbi:MAG: XrtN system VIT domain-containing protein [Bacteroidota bacterium]
MNNWKTLYSIGWMFVAFNSLAFYVGTHGQIGLEPSGSTDWGLSLVMISLILSAIYFISILIHHHRVFGKGNVWKNTWRGDQRLYSLALVNFSLSAHILNFTTEIQVFAPYVGWLGAYMLLMHTTILLFPFRASLSEWGQYMLYFLCGSSAVLALYFTLFLGPLVGFSIVLAFVLGISLHAIAPVFFLIEMILAYRRMEPLPHAKKAYYLGLIVPVMVLGFYMMQWQNLQNTIQKEIHTYSQTAPQDLPQWVYISQQLPENELVESILKGKAFTQYSFWTESYGMLNFRSREFVRHDPFSLIATVCFGELNLERENLTKIMESRYDVRHHTHRRLWRGSNLATTHIHSVTEVYADQRLSYQEMTLTIQNQHIRPNNQQEAVYSFYLPEGAAVTSLSLWINGVEEKSRLTTRAKADSAYMRIVGVERRDPALLHWQEGNRVTVTVFPCTPAEDRKVKIGFSAPLIYEEGKLTLAQVAFDGPDYTEAECEREVRFIGAVPEGIDKGWGWTQGKDQTYHYDGPYKPQNSLSFVAPPLSAAGFSFEGNIYQAVENESPTEKWNPQSIILDIHSGWNPEDFEKVWEQTNEKEVYVFTPKKTQVTEENHQALFQQLSLQQFSMIPFYQIDVPEQTLVISTHGHTSPIFEDLKYSAYKKKTEAYFQQQKTPLKWYNIGSVLTDYAQSLESLRLLDVKRGNMQELCGLLQQKVYPTSADGVGKRWIPSAQMYIREVELDAVSQVDTTGSNHLFRLYMYQHVLAEIGSEFFDKKALERQWTEDAARAYIVTPVSSLIVLETVEDYERFDIEENKDSIGNAQLNNNGAVPEPHEWALIVLVVLSILFYIRKTRKV